MKIKLYEKIQASKLKKLAASLQNGVVVRKNPSLKPIVADLHMGKAPDKKQVAKLKDDVKDELAIAAVDILGPDDTVKVLGVDVDEQAIRQARADTIVEESKGRISDALYGREITRKPTNEDISRALKTLKEMRDVDVCERHLAFVEYALDEINEYMEQIDELPKDFPYGYIENAYHAIMQVHGYVEGDKVLRGLDEAKDVNKEKIAVLQNMYKRMFKDVSGREARNIPDDEGKLRRMIEIVAADLAKMIKQGQMPKSSGVR